MSKVSNEEAT